MLNQISIMGRIGREIEVKTTQSGVSVCNFTVAVDRDYRNGDEKITDWFDCVAWRGTAEFLQKYAGKGRMVVVNGSMQSRKWEDRDGNKRLNWEIQVQNVYLADSRRDADAPAAAELKELPADDENLPF